MTVRVSPMAPASLAETRARRRLGIAMAAMMPMIATTISNSISVNPFCVLKAFSFHRTGGASLAAPAGLRGTVEGGTGRPPSGFGLLERRAGRGNQAARAVAASDGRVA